MTEKFSEGPNSSANAASAGASNTINEGRTACADHRGRLHCASGGRQTRIAIIVYRAPGDSAVEDLVDVAAAAFLSVGLVDQRLGGLLQLELELGEPPLPEVLQGLRIGDRLTKKLAQNQQIELDCGCRSIRDSAGP